jgi:hypothetical protein
MSFSMAMTARATNVVANSISREAAAPPLPTDSPPSPIFSDVAVMSGIAFIKAGTSTTLADLLTPLLVANPFSAMRATLRLGRAADAADHAWQLARSSAHRQGRLDTGRRHADPCQIAHY